MSLKSRFFKFPLWLRGGLTGIATCFILFVFYIALYFPLITRTYGGMLPNWTTALPMATGHIFPMLSGLYSPAELLCKPTVSSCSTWTVWQSPGSVAWTLPTGERGYCEHITMEPTSACANLYDHLQFYFLIFTLFLIYFTLGAIIALLIKKFRHR